MAAATYPEEDHDECSLHCRVVRHIACPEWHMQRAFGLLVVDERTHRRDFDLSCAVRYRCKVLTARARAYARREKSKGTVAVLPFYSKL